ncbi:hypothetical protein NLX77_17315 [Serratia marcescens]|uniref:hypothetical protein n=1 Tax=Serratia marcescens TaxID=615 RepID=UPI0020C54957|nr:hypothetical protein [Serratia marcescens]UTL84701.1 hypothetical protein NLX77_17315 [Serratia marcescens]
MEIHQLRKAGMPLFWQEAERAVRRRITLAAVAEADLRFFYAGFRNLYAIFTGIWIR